MNKNGFPFSPDWGVQDVLCAEIKNKVSRKGELAVRCPLNREKWFEVNIVKGGAWKCYKA